MIYIKKNYIVSNVSANHLYKLCEELDKLEISYVASQDKKNKKMYTVTVNDSEKSKVTVVYAKIKSKDNEVK